MLSASNVNAQLTIDKSPNYSFAIVGTVIPFSLLISNTGNVNLNNVLVFDQLDSNLKFTTGSVMINSIPSPLDSMISGVNLGTLKPGDKYTISFNATVLSTPNGNVIYNTAKSQYSYVPSPGANTVIGFNNSDRVEINISTAHMTVLKTADKAVANLGDTITYNIKLTNDGDLDAINVSLIDTLPNGLDLVKGSFTVNGSVINSVDLTNVFISHSLPVGSTTNISYKVKVGSIACGCHADNTALVKFRYTLPDGVAGTYQTPATPMSTASVFLNISNFKQFSIEEYLQIPCQKPDIEEINFINGSVDVVKCMVIETTPSMSVEGQTLTNYKLIVHGILKLTIEYTACEPQQGVHSATYSVPFSSFIVLPANFVPGSSIDIDGVVEDVYFNVADCRRFFTNSTVLLKACILSC